jgi:hypothetical protein
LRKLQGRGVLGAADIQAAQSLYGRYPDEPYVRDLLVSVLLGAGQQALTERRYADAADDCRRAVAASPQSLVTRRALLDVLTEAQDWGNAEAAARSVLELAPDNKDALQAQAYALFRQDRNREAGDVCRRILAMGPDAFATSLLARIEKGVADEKGMTEQRISHFHVRYDGDAHDEIGHEILASLERHYSTLAGTLDHQPSTPIPVILFSRDQYYNASGAPAWSGGVYDPGDGRIRVPIGGLSGSLPSDIDPVLLHECTHAFVADLTKGVAPRDIHEGFAQYMEGKRTASLLSSAQLQMLADGRAGGVGGFYMLALSFVEYLMQTHGQGGMNDLFRAMGDTGDVDEAFRRVHGQDYSATRRAWIARLKQQYGS